MVVRHLAVVLALIAFVAGCGGGESDDGAKGAASSGSPSSAAPTTTAPPRIFTIHELKAALPEKDDVPGATSVEFRCPEDGKKKCGDDTSVTVALTLASVVVGSAEDTERRAGSALVDDSALVNALIFGSDAEAETNMAESRQSAQEFAGSFDFTESKSSFGLPEKGSGTLDDLAIGDWTGYVSARTSHVDLDGKTQDLQNVLVAVRNGTAKASVNVLVDSTGRPAEFATDLARATLSDYIERLS